MKYDYEQTMTNTVSYLPNWTASSVTDKTVLFDRYDAGFNGTIEETRIDAIMVINIGTDYIAPDAYPSTAVNDNSIGTIAWTNVNNATGYTPSTYAQVALNQNEVSNYLKLTNFGINLPSNAVVDGIKVTLYANGSSGVIYDTTVKLVKNGTIVGDNKAQNSSMNTTKIYGGTSDLWGTTWTVSDINSSNFGFVISCTQQNVSSVLTAMVYWCQIVIYYHYDVQITGKWVINPQNLGDEAIDTQTWTYRSNSSFNASHHISDIKYASDFTNAKTPYILKYKISWTNSSGNDITVTTTPGSIVIRTIGTVE